MSLYGDNEIELYGYRFRVTPSPIQEQLASVFPGKIVIGDTRRVDDPIASTYTMEDWIDGGLKHWMDPTIDMNRFFFSSLNTMFNRQLTLLPLTRYAAPLAWSDGKIKQVRAGAEMNNIQYIGWDDVATYLDINENVTFVPGATTSVGASNIILEMLPYRVYAGTAAGSMRLIIRWLNTSTNATGYHVFDTVNGMVAGSGTMQAVTVWDNKLVRVDDTNQAQTTLDLVTWTNLPGTTIVPLPNGDVTGLLVFPDLYGNDTLQFCTTQGLYFYDEVLQEIRPTRYRLPRIATQGKGSIVHRDNLYYAHSQGSGITRFTGTTVDEMGLNRDDQLPPAYRGNLAMLQTTLNFLLAAVSSSITNASANPIFSGGETLATADTVSSSSGYSGIYAQPHAGGGWHTQFLSDLQNTGCYWVGASAATGGPTNSGYRLFFGTNGLLGIQDLYPDVLNPLYNPTQQYATTGQLITPWNEAGWSEISKLMIRQEFGVNGTGLASNGTLCTTAVRPACNIVLDYALDYDDTNWTNLTTITTAAPAPAYYASLNTTPPTYLGISAKAFRFRWTLNRCDDITHTPVLVWSTLTFLKEMSARWGYRLQLDLSNDVQGRTPAQQAALLRSLADPSDPTVDGELGTFRGWVDGQFTVRNVRISELSGNVVEGTLQKGVYNVALIAF